MRSRVKGLPDVVDFALADFATGGPVTITYRGVWDAIGIEHAARDSHAAQKRRSGKPIVDWIRRRWARRSGFWIDAATVEVSALIDHRDGTAVPCVTITATGYGGDRLTVGWSGHSGEEIHHWLDRVADGWRAMSIRVPRKAREEDDDNV